MSKITRGLRFAAAMMGLAAGLAPAAAPAETTLRFIPQADLRSIDPIWTTAYVTRNFGYLVFDMQEVDQFQQIAALQTGLGLFAAHARSSEDDPRQACLHQHRSVLVRAFRAVARSGLLALTSCFCSLFIVGSGGVVFKEERQARGPPRPQSGHRMVFYATSTLFGYQG